MLIEKDMDASTLAKDYQTIYSFYWLWVAISKPVLGTVKINVNL